MPARPSSMPRCTTAERLVILAAQCLNFANDLVTGCHMRQMRRQIPFGNMQIRAAHPACQHMNQRLTGAGLRNRRFHPFQWIGFDGSGLFFNTPNMHHFLRKVSHTFTLDRGCAKRHGGFCGMRGCGSQGVRWHLPCSKADGWRTSVENLGFGNGGARFQTPIRYRMLSNCY